MIRTIERATGNEYTAKAIEGGYEVFTAEGERYKKLKESTFKRYFKVLGEAAVEPKAEEPEVEEPEYDEPEQPTVEPEVEEPAAEPEEEEAPAEEPKPEKKSNKQKSEKAEKKGTPVIELEGVIRENMIEKIKKMLNLSENNPSEAEGLAAALHAQKLMAKYNIHEDEVTLEEIKEDEIDSLTAPLKDDSSLHTWRKNLGLVVAKNFRVKCYMHGKDVTFRGFVEDVKVAVEVFTYLYALGNKLGSKKYHEQLKETGSAKGVYNSFVIGFLHGVEEALNEQCTALMLVTPKAVEEEYKIFAEENFKKKGQKALVEFKGGQFYEEGKTEGKAAVKSKQLDTKKNKGGKK